MKRKHVFVPVMLFAVLPAVLFNSCKKDKDEEPAPNPGNGNSSTTITYSFPMTTGSYWIYQHEKLDSLGNIIDAGAIDSVFISGDTVIGSNTYKKYGRVTGPGTAWYPFYAGLPVLRDSAGYQVSPDGSFIEYNNLTDTLDSSSTPGLIESYYAMNSPDSMLVTPAGTFQTVDYRGTHHITAANYPYSTIRYTHQFLGNGVGLVQASLFYFSSPWYMRIRLIRYHIA